MQYPVVPLKNHHINMHDSTKYYIFPIHRLEKQIIKQNIVNIVCMLAIVISDFMILKSLRNCY